MSEDPGLAQSQYGLEDPATLLASTAMDLKKRTTELQQSSKLGQVRRARGKSDGVIHSWRGRGSANI